MVLLGDGIRHFKRVTLGKSHVVHLKEWLTISHIWEMIPWLILSHVGDDVIKRNLENKKL